MTNYYSIIRKSYMLFAMVVLLFWGLGCSQTTELTPPLEADEPAMMQNAISNSTVADVRVLVQEDAWPGQASRPEIMGEVTPVRVTIHNDSEVPLRLRYSEFALVGPEGEHFAALPLYSLDGTVEEPVLVEAYKPVTAPTFIYEGFQVAPYYGSLYPTLAPYVGLFYFDPMYYDRYGDYWKDMVLPTEEMQAEALPEGVVQSDGRVTGLVYFEKVDDDLSYVRFRADLVSAVDGREFGEVSIPFVVEG